MVASDESEYGVSLKAEPDPNRVGKRLKGDFKKVSEKVKNLADEELRQFEATGEIVVEGYTLDSDDIKVGGRVWCDDHTSSHHYPMYIPPTLLLPSVDLLLSAGSFLWQL